MSKEEMILDVVPIYKNEMYPTKDAIWHFKTEIHKETDREYTLNNMIIKIKHEFSNCDAIIVIENGMVIEVLGGKYE